MALASERIRQRLSMLTSQDLASTFFVSSASQISNNRYSAHSMQRIRCFWFCWTSLVLNTWAVSPGQSGDLSRSSSRRFVAKAETAGDA